MRLVVLRAEQATVGAILSPCLCVLAVCWDLQRKCQQVQVPKSSEVYRLYCTLCNV